MSNILASVGGFLLLPMLGGLASRIAATTGEVALPNAKPGQVAAAAGVLAHGALAYSLYKVSEEHSGGTAAFLRGGMWGAGIASAFCAAAPVISSSPSPVLVSGSIPQVDKAFNLLTAQAAGAVAAKRARKVLPAAARAIAR